MNLEIILIEIDLSSVNPEIIYFYIFWLKTSFIYHTNTCMKFKS